MLPFFMRRHPTPRIHKQLGIRLTDVGSPWPCRGRTRREYLSDHAAIQRELRQVQPPDHQPVVLEKLALFLGDVATAWDAATQEQRNRLASILFEAVWIKDTRVTAVTPTPEFKPFFDLQYEGMSQYVLRWRPRGDSGSEVRYTAYDITALCPQIKPAAVSRSRIPRSAWPEPSEHNQTKTLRELAKDYGVSHEAVRRALKSVRGVRPIL